MNRDHWLIKKDVFLIGGTAVFATFVVFCAYQLVKAHPSAPLADAALWWLGVLVGFPLSVALHGLLGWFIAAVVARRRRNAGRVKR